MRSLHRKFRIGCALISILTDKDFGAENSKAFHLNLMNYSASLKLSTWLSDLGVRSKMFDKNDFNISLLSFELNIRLKINLSFEFHCFFGFKLIVLFS